MAFYCFFENVSSVRRLKDEYCELVDNFNYQIKRIEGNINNSIDDLHKILKSYSS